MDLGQQYDTYGSGYSGFGTLGLQGGDFIHGYMPYYLPVKREAYASMPTASSLVHTDHIYHGGRRYFRSEVPNPLPGFQANAPYNSDVATGPENSDKTCVYSGHFSAQIMASGYGPADPAFQNGVYYGNQQDRISDLTQSII